MSLHRIRARGTALSCVRERRAVAAAPQRALDPRIHLGHGVVCLPPRMKHPIKLAKRIATLDILSKGRVHCGVGKGGTRQEAGAFGYDLAELQPMIDESACTRTESLVSAGSRGIGGPRARLRRPGGGGEEERGLPAGLGGPPREAGTPAVPSAAEAFPRLVPGSDFKSGRSAPNMLRSAETGLSWFDPVRSRPRVPTLPPHPERLS